MAQYPGASATDSNLWVAKNNQPTSTLNGALTSSGDNTGGSGIAVGSTSGFPATGGYISIDQEVIQYTGITGNNFTGITRGSDGTTAASHANSSSVFHNVVADHHNTLKEEIKAIESDLVGVQASLTPVSAANTATNILNRISQIVQRFKDFAGLTNWYDAFTSFPVNKGGTGNTTLASGAYLKGAGTSAITTQATPIPVADGGTNSGTSLNNNRIMVSTGGAIVERAAVTANRTIASDGSGLPIARAATVQVTSTTGTNVSATTWTDTSLSGSITPSSTSARIKITCSGLVGVVSAHQGFLTINSSVNGDVTGSTPSTNPLTAFGATAALQEGAIPFCIQWIDAPATTSVVTYKLRAAADTGGTTRVGGGGGAGELSNTLVMILEEVA